MTTMTMTLCKVCSTDIKILVRLGPHGGLNSLGLKFYLRNVVAVFFILATYDKFHWVQMFFQYALDIQVLVSRQL